MPKSSAVLSERALRPPSTESSLPTQANAEALIRETLANPNSVFVGDKVIDVFNAAGQGVRIDRATSTFVGFLEQGLVRP